MYNINMRLEEHKTKVIELLLTHTNICKDIIIHCILPYLRIVIGPYCDMRNIDLSGIDFEDTDLTGANFEDANCTGCNFSNVTKCENIVLKNCIMTRAYISHCMLKIYEKLSYSEQRNANVSMMYSFKL
jgi:uncharacterized protein YjbI with pentapeptide repeats